MSEKPDDNSCPRAHPAFDLAEYLDGYFGVGTEEPFVSYEHWTSEDSYKLAVNLVDERFTPGWRNQ